MTINTTGRWKLPQPVDIKDEDEWLAIPRVARVIPFGYIVDPEDDKVLLPVKIELDLLEKAKQYLLQYSYREVANWLSTNSGREISHVGLRKRVADERTRTNQAKSLRRWAEYAQAALAKAEELEQKGIGAKASKATGTS
jgi:hypothetical protein